MSSPPSSTGAAPRPTRPGPPDERPVCVVTGASGGIASAIARRLAREGHALVLMSRSGCGELAAELGQVGIAGSVLEDADVERACALAVERFGRLYAAVFIGGRQSGILKRHAIPPAPPATPAGFAHDADYRRELFDIPFEAWPDNYDMNALGPMRLFRSALPHFRAAGGGAFAAIPGLVRAMASP